MKTRISPNSLEAFEKVNLSKRQQEVFDTIEEIGSVTAKGIAYSMKVPINKVTGRINELMHKQIIKIDKVGRDVANRRQNVNYYAIRKESDPENIFEKTWEEKYIELRNRFSSGLVEEAKKERRDFVKAINEQEWNTQMRASADSLMIMYDQLVDVLDL